MRELPEYQIALSKITEKARLKCQKLKRVEEPSKKVFKAERNLDGKLVLCYSCFVLNRFYFVVEASVIRLVVNYITIS